MFSYFEIVYVISVRGAERQRRNDGGGSARACQPSCSREVDTSNYFPPFEIIFNTHYTSSIYSSPPTASTPSIEHSREGLKNKNTREVRPSKSVNALARLGSSQTRDLVQWEEGRPLSRPQVAAKSALDSIGKITKTMKQRRQPPTKKTSIIRSWARTPTAREI